MENKVSGFNISVCYSVTCQEMTACHVTIYLPVNNNNKVADAFRMNYYTE